MSDIGFYGLAAFLVGLAMLAVAIVGFLIEVLIMWRRRQHRQPRRLILLAPLLYGVLAVAMLGMAEEGTLTWKARLDDVAVPLSVVGLLPWVAVHLYGRRRPQVKPVQPGRRGDDQ